ncbi:MAG TPA: EVE domain-containing protein [Trebonia sp.]|nr:EVE domain-containing protein [Trebonia sp.]
MASTKPTYVTVRDAHLPATIDGWNGQTYHKREVAAMNVRHGDRVVFWDFTDTNAHGRYGIARVICAGYDKSAHPWERTVLYVAEWRGADGVACELKSYMRPDKITYGTRDRVTVWRAA